MDLLKMTNKKTWEFISVIDTTAWCRYQFRHASQTNLLVNNIFKSFNNNIINVRDKLPVTLVEEIQKMLMSYFVNRQINVENQSHQLGRNIVKKLRR